MKNKIYLLYVISFLFISCFSKNELNINEDILNTNCEFVQSDTTDLNIKINNKTYKISNLDKYNNQKNNWFAFFNLDETRKKQLLVVYNAENKAFDYCYFYPDYSYFFDDELVCFSINVEPNQYPLPKLYEITTCIKDFRNCVEKQFIEHSRFWTSSIDNVQDFYYRKPKFNKTENKYIKRNFLSAIDKKYDKEDTVLYVLWEQANFPISCTYYYLNRQKFGTTCAYPNINDSEVYRTGNEELKIIEDMPEENGKKTISLSKEEKLNSEYSDYKIQVSDDANTEIFYINDFFEYKDPFEKVELAESPEGYVCFIITTKVFAYDVYINLKTKEINIYLRASSFPPKNRALE